MTILLLLGSVGTTLSPDDRPASKLQAMTLTLPLVPSCTHCAHGAHVLHALARAVEQKDPLTAGHCQRVAVLSLQLADRLGLTDLARHEIRLAAELHDIGKLGLRDAILLKAGPLTSIERMIMEQHVLSGVEIVRPVFPEIVPAIQHHHEQPNGLGYPHGLRGDAIPLAARIIAVADSWDAMTSDRVYRPGMEPAQAAVIMRTDNHQQWDATLVAVLLALVG